jgi:hypothetical protein
MELQKSSKDLKVANRYMGKNLLNTTLHLLEHLFLSFLSKRQKMVSIGEDGIKRELLYTAGNINQCNHYVKHQ